MVGHWLQVTFPSGTVTQEATTGKGEATFSIPKGEPAYGSVTVRSNAGSAVARVFYGEHPRFSKQQLDRHLSPLKSDARACARAAGAAGTLAVRLVVERGRVEVRVPSKKGKWGFAECVADAARNLVVPRAPRVKLTLRFYVATEACDALVARWRAEKTDLSNKTVLHDQIDKQCGSLVTVRATTS